MARDGLGDGLDVIQRDADVVQSIGDHFVLFIHVAALLQAGHKGLHEGARLGSVPVHGTRAVPASGQA